MCYNTRNNTDYNPYLESAMITYTKEEFVGSTELAKGLGGFLDKVVSGDLEKIAIVRHNKPEAVVIPISVYERMELVMEHIDNIEIEEIVMKRDPDGIREGGGFDFKSYHKERLLRRENVHA